MSLACLASSLQAYCLAHIFSDNNVIGAIVTRQCGFDTRVLVQKEQTFITLIACLDTVIWN